MISGYQLPFATNRANKPRRIPSERALRWYQRVQGWGVNPQATTALLKEYLRVREDKTTFESQRATSEYSASFPSGHDLRVYRDIGGAAGVMRGHYFHQDLLVAQDIFRRNPRHHIDVGSRIDGFVAHVASFREITVYDIRPPLAPDVTRITFERADVSAADFSPHQTADSVSCLHALEHFGLGRYGDLIDFDGWRKGLLGLRKLVQPGGTLYLSLPTSEKQRVEFNAQRIFSIPFTLSVIEPNFRVERLDFVDDSGDLHLNQDAYDRFAQRSFGARYGCAIWTLRAHEGG